MSATCPNGHPSTSEDYCDVCGMPIASGGAGAGAGVGAGPTAAAPTPAAAGVAGQACPNCGTDNVVDALFCEACGYDFTTGTMPRSAVPLTPPGGSSAVASGAGSAGGGDAPGAAASTPAAPASSAPVRDASTPAASTPAPAAPAPDASFDWVAEVWIDPAWYEGQDTTDALPSPGLPEIVPLRSSSVLVGRRSRSRNITPDIDCELDSGASRRQAQLTTDGTRWWVEDLDSANGTFVGAASDPLPETPIPVGPKRELKPDDRIYLGAWTRIVIRRATDDERATLG